MANTQGPMTCPVDGATLVMSERSGIEIDYCPTCRGVWLDRGELNKIIERNAEQMPAGAPPQQAPQQGSWGGQSQQPHCDQGHRGKPHKKRRSFLDELFD